MEAIKRRGKYREVIRKLTDGVLETVTDAVLFTLFVTAELSSRRIAPAFSEASKDLLGLNYKIIRRALMALKNKGFVDQKDRVTLLGRDYCQKILPELFEPKDRPPGSLFLIIYDIGEQTGFSRRGLPRFLKRHNCKMIQESVYLSVSDPREFLKEYIEQTMTAGKIIVTRLGENSMIGDDNLKDYLNKLYGLDELNRQYEEFIKQFKNKPSSPAKFFAYAKIRKQDPGLPPEFSPDDWAGNAAFKLITY